MPLYWFSSTDASLQMLVVLLQRSPPTVNASLRVLSYWFFAIRASFEAPKEFAFGKHLKREVLAISGMRVILQFSEFSENSTLFEAIMDLELSTGGQC